MPSSAQAVNRGRNFFVVAILSMLALAAVSELFEESGLVDRLDDYALLVLGIAGAAWYLRGQDRFAYSLAPLSFAAAGLAVKLAGLYLEIDDPKAYGEDVGIVLLLSLTLMLGAWQYLKWGGGR